MNLSTGHGLARPYTQTYCQRESSTLWGFCSTRICSLWMWTESYIEMLINARWQTLIWNCSMKPISKRTHKQWFRIVTSTTEEATTIIRQFSNSKLRLAPYTSLTTSFWWISKSTEMLITQTGFGITTWNGTTSMATIPFSFLKTCKALARLRFLSTPSTKNGNGLRHSAILRRKNRPAL